MSALTPRITRQRLLGATAVMVVALVLGYFAGIDMQAFSLGMLLGIVVVGIVAAVLWYRARRPGPGN